MMQEHTKQRVIIFKSELLRDSEVFIREQVTSYSRWKPILAGFFPGTLDLSGLELDLLNGPSPSKWTNGTRALLRELNLPQPGALRRLKRWNPSLMHIHFGTELVSIWPTARSLGVPILTTLHGFDIHVNAESWSKEPFPDRFYPRRLAAIAQDPRVNFIAVSDAIREQAIERGIPESKIFTQYIGVDISRFVPGSRPIDKRTKRILYVGRMVEKKGGNVLLEAFAAVRNRVEDAELVMVGAGPMLEEYRQLARKLQLPVEFPGALPSDRVKEHIDQARVFCLPSITARNGDAEGFGLVLLEAQACGVPVVTSARGGAREGIKDGKTGFAFKEGDVRALESALIRILTDDTLANSMSREARHHVENTFDIARCTASLEDLYDRIVGATASAP